MNYQFRIRGDDQAIEFKFSSGGQGQVDINIIDRIYGYDDIKGLSMIQTDVLRCAGLVVVSINGIKRGPLWDQFYPLYIKAMRYT